MENWIRIRSLDDDSRCKISFPSSLSLVLSITKRIIILRYATFTLLDINIHFQPRNRRSESKHIYIYIHIKPILLPSSTSVRTSSLGGSRVSSSRLGYAPNKKGSQWWCPKGGVPREIKISFGRNDSVVTKYAAYARVSNFCLRYSMFRCRKGGADPTPRKEGAGNPSKSAGHMLEEREIRVLYYSRAARDTTLPPDF